MKSIKLICTIFGLIIALGVFIIGCSGNKATNTIKNIGSGINVASATLGNTSGNIVNGGLLCENNGWIYYRSEADNWSLHKAHIDKSGDQKISDDIPSYINVVGDWIYYSNYSDGHKLYKIKTNGTNKTRLSECQVSNITVINDKIYYINWDNKDENHINELFKMNIDGKDNTKIGDRPCSSIGTDGEYLYVTCPSGKAEFSIFKVTLDSYTFNQLNRGQYSHFINIQKNYIYYWSVNENKLRRMKKDGSENIVLSDISPDYVNSDDKWVYFVNKNDGSNIYRLNTNTNVCERLTDIPKDNPNDLNTPSSSPSSVYIANGYTFYRGFDIKGDNDAFFVVKPGKKIQEVWDEK